MYCRRASSSQKQSERSGTTKRQSVNSAQLCRRWRGQRAPKRAHLSVCGCRRYSWNPHTERCDLPRQMAFGTARGWGPLPPLLSPALTLPDLWQDNKNKNRFRSCPSSYVASGQTGFSNVSSVDLPWSFRFLAITIPSSGKRAMLQPEA